MEFESDEEKAEEQLEKNPQDAVGIQKFKAYRAAFGLGRQFHLARMGQFTENLSGHLRTHYDAVAQISMTFVTCTPVQLVLK